MATPIVRRSSNQSSRSEEPGRSKSITTRRFAAWAAEMTLLVVSGLVPYGIGAYLNSRSDLNRVPLNPVLVGTERAIARPLALPVSYGIRNVAFPTNFLWTVAILAPLTLSAWQFYLLAKTGSTIPKRWFGIRVINSEGTPPGLRSVLVREGIGRWTVPMSIAYLVWRYSFLYPNPSIFTVLAALSLAAEATGFPWREDRRAFHDRIAGTYTIDITKDTPPLISGKSTSQSDQSAAIPSIAAAKQPSLKFDLWRRLQENPSLRLMVVALLSMSGVLVTLVGTQIYVQTQQNRRALEQRNSQQFLALVKQSNSNSGVSDEQRRSAILAMGTLNYPQATKHLVDLLNKETNPMLVDAIQQALVNVGLSAIPDLKRMNQLLKSELGAANSAPQERELGQQRLSNNQGAINKILAVSSGQLDGIDLDRVQLGQSGTGESFKLVLETKDLSGAKLRFANFNRASFKGSRFRNPGEDGRWDTYDDTIANLFGVKMTQANLTGANLSRVLLNRSDLSRANLNRANLSNARMINANLSSTQLVGADLRSAVLQNASLTGADLGDAKLNEADLYGARLGRVIAIGTQFSFANLINTDWQEADLSGAYLDRANLSHAKLNAARLTGASLQSANLEGANLQNADLSLANLQGANLAGADFRGAILTPSKQDPADQFVQTPAIGLQSAVVKGVDFTQVKNLDTKQLAYICTQGGIHPHCPQ